MLNQLKALLGINTVNEHYDEIEQSLHKEQSAKDLLFYLLIIAYEVIMVISISFRPGGPFARPRRIAYFFMYLILIAVTAVVMLLEVRASKKKENGHQLYFRIEAIYMVFFCFWGLAVTLTDQLGGNGLTVYTYVILILAIRSVMKPWKTTLLIAIGFVLLNFLLPYFPDPNGLDNTYNNLMNSAFLSLAAIVITVNFYNSKIQAKRDEMVIKKQYQQIEAINGMLREEAHVDALTGLKNRTSYNKVIRAFDETTASSLACIYIDANGLHEINNYLGHQAGDEMLIAVADILKEHFKPEEIFRIGGDEFVVLQKGIDCKAIIQKIETIREEAEKRGYSLSLGYEWRDTNLDLWEMIQAAETAMKENKDKYYIAMGKQRQTRELNTKMERIISEKKDADHFLNVLTPAFKGVYYVNLETDTSRHLFIPEYFKEMLEETCNQYSKAIMLYAHRMVKEEYHSLFETFTDYEHLNKLLEENSIPGFIFERKDGIRLKLQVLTFSHHSDGYREVLWIFSELSAAVMVHDNL